MFLDESGFSRTPTVRRTLAPMREDAGAGRLGPLECHQLRHTQPGGRRPGLSSTCSTTTSTARITYGQLANLAVNDKQELWDWVLEELIAVKHRPDVLNAFIQQTSPPGIALAA